MALSFLGGGLALKTCADQKILVTVCWQMDGLVMAFSIAKVGC